MNPRVVLVSLVFASSALAQSAETMQKLLDREALKVAAWCSDPAIVAAVKAQNAKRVSLDSIKALDTRWSPEKPRIS
jgi:hypothetical protein